MARATQGEKWLQHVQQGAKGEKACQLLWHRVAPLCSLPCANRVLVFECISFSTLPAPGLSPAAFLTLFVSSRCCTSATSSLSCPLTLYPYPPEPLLSSLNGALRQRGGVQPPGGDGVCTPALLQMPMYSDASTGSIHDAAKMLRRCSAWCRLPAVTLPPSYALSDRHFAISSTATPRTAFLTRRLHANIFIGGAVDFRATLPTEK